MKITYIFCKLVIILYNWSVKIMKISSFKTKILALTIISIFLFQIVPQSVWAAEPLKNMGDPNSFSEKEKNLDWIYIFYDPQDENMKYVAESVHEVISFRLLNVKLVPLSSSNDLKITLMDNPWMAVYAFNSNLAGVKFSDESISWQEFYQILNVFRNTQHIVGMANTITFNKQISTQNSNIHHSDVEQTDVILLVMYNIWAISQIIEQRSQVNEEYVDAARDLTQMAMQIYAENFNALFKAQIDPITPVGQIDPVGLEERTKEMWDRHQPEIRPAAYIMDEEGALIEIPQDKIPEDFSPNIKLGLPSAAEGDFILGDLPFLSGLRGPIGDIVDILLKVLESSGNTVLSIPNDAMETIKEMFGMIESVVGIVDNFDDESPLKSIISAISKEFPFPEEMKPYVDLFLKALFNMRGEPADILEIVMELVQVLISELLPESVSDIIETVLDLGDDLWDFISEAKSSGKSIFNTLVSHFSKNILSKLLNKTLVASLGLDQGDIGGFLTKMEAFISPTIKFLVSFDVPELIEDVGGPLLEAVLGSLDSNTQEAVGKVNSMINLAFGVVDLVDDFNSESIINLVKLVLEEVIGSSEIIGDVENLTRRIMDIVKNFQENGLPSVSDFKNQIQTALTNAVESSVPTSTREIIADIMAMITGIYNDGFNPAELPDLFQIAEAILDEVGLTDVKNAISGVVKPIVAMISYLTDSGSLKQMLQNTLSSYPSDLTAIPTLIKEVFEFLDVGDMFDGLPDFDSIVNSFGEITGGIMNMVGAIKEKSFKGVLQSIFMAVGSIVGVHPSFDNVPIDAFLKLIQSFFPDAFGLDPANLPSSTEVINEIMDMASSLLEGVIDPALLEEFLKLSMDLKGLFTNGVDWMIGKVLDWLTGLITPIMDDLEEAIMSFFGNDNEIIGFHTTLPIGLGEWSLFELEIDLGIIANINLNPTPLFNLVKSLILDGRSTLSLDSIDDFFKVIFSFFEISPQFYAELGVAGLDSSKNSFMTFLLESLGLDLSFTGSAHFVLNLFTFRGGMFEWENFFKVVEWSFNIKIQLSKTFTLLDFLTGGVGGGALSSIAEFLGLDAITVTIYLGVELDIVKKAAMATAPEESSLTLIIILGCAIHIGINLLIVEIVFDGSLEIILTFFQDLASSAPLKITLRLVLTLKVKLRFLFISDTHTWTWEPGGPWDLSPNKGDAEYEASGVGFDSDGDGLSDEYEADIPGLDINNPDTDGDGANDKLEVQTMGTDPTIPDTDFDGLTDGEEWDLGTNPLEKDSDWEGLTDYQEVKIYMTDPLSQDTDGDSLSDFYEVFTRWDISNVTPTVLEVMIGGELYNDRTDPLNPDTDGDGLMDGDEGPMGAYYGLDALYNESESDPNPLIFNYGYTHPLDADTDDDSYYQLYNGMVDTQLNQNFLKDMNDGAEVAGFDIIMYDEEGEPELKHVMTNPCNPDTDGDTGITDRTPQPGMWINSDGYELAQDPPTDPTDGDSDDDGLIDGIEGVLNPYSNHTNPNDPDTDDDGLFDMQEILLGTDPRAADTDFDMIPDGDEFYIFYTNPNVGDTDFDGLSDGEEVYLWHSNPLSDDSDGDGITDGQEVLYYGSDPMDDDGDNDGLTDFEEIKVYYTNAFDYDSDDDGLSDGEEILIYYTDPLNWDTDGDSIVEPNEFGEMTWPMSDYHEVKIYGTNPTEADSDLDGLGDGIELYLGSGIIPWIDPIPLNPLSNDTDGDGFADGSEIQIRNVTDIIYPFLAVTLVFPFYTDPCSNDTDNDNVSDYVEVMIYNSDPNLIDTDNDTLSDWDEIYLYNTSAIYNDTDGDGLFDYEELLVPINSSIRSASGSHPLAANYGTDPLNPDTDGDYLPDGAEVLFYETDPINSDTDGDGVLDGFEFDTDYDGLPDGEEFRLGLQQIGGGILNPDSDGDGLLDGDEVNEYGTNPANSDTDGDGYSDGIEITIGTDPLSYTTQEEFENYLATARGNQTLHILLPKEDSNVYIDTPVQVVNLTDFQEVWYRYRNDSDWSEDISMIYKSSVQQWYNDTTQWYPGSYELEVYGRDMNGSIHLASIEFDVVEKDYTLIIIGVSVGVAGLAVITGIIVSKRKKSAKRAKEATQLKESAKEVKEAAQLKGKKSLKKETVKKSSKTKKILKKEGKK